MPRWKELKRFCERDGWEFYKNIDHYFYRKVMDNGDIKRVKISRGSHEIPKRLWNETLKRQLKVSKEYFNDIK